MATRNRRAGATALTVLVAAVLAAGGVAVANGQHDEAAPSATAAPSEADGGATGPAGEGTVVIDRTGPDLPGAGVLDRCRTDGRATVARYETAALGSVMLQCGNGSQGYAHIAVRHTADWNDVLRDADAGSSGSAGSGGINDSAGSARSDRDWDDVMLTAVHTVLTAPRTGFPVDAGDGKVCYAAPLRFDDGSAPDEPFVKVIVSETTDRVITAYPTNRSDC